MKGSNRRAVRARRRANGKPSPASQPKEFEFHLQATQIPDPEVATEETEGYVVRGRFGTSRVVWRLNAAAQAAAARRTR